MLIIRNTLNEFALGFTDCIKDGMAAILENGSCQGMLDYM